MKKILKYLPDCVCPLVANLKNPDYVKLVFEDESKMAMKFSEIDVEIIRTIAIKHYTTKKNLVSNKIKRKVLRQAQFKNHKFLYYYRSLSMLLADDPVLRIFKICAIRAIDDY